MELKVIFATPHPKMKNACDGAIEVYPKSDVDTVIEEKDRVIEFAKALTLKDIEIIKEKDKEIAELKAENRRLNRALYKACANWACAKMEYEQFDSNMFMCGFITDKEVSWKSMMKKCLKKAEEYK